MINAKKNGKKTRKKRRRKNYPFVRDSSGMNLVLNKERKRTQELISQELLNQKNDQCKKMERKLGKKEEKITHLYMTVIERTGFPPCH